jgi:hypothetical protein
MDARSGDGFIQAGRCGELVITRHADGVPALGMAEFAFAVAPTPE